MSQYLIDQIATTSNIDVVTQSEVTGATGAERLEAVEITNRQTGVAETVPGAAVFLFIGAKPHTEFLGEVVARNDAGFVLTGPDLVADGGDVDKWPLKRGPYLLETNVPGIFAVGDVREGVVRRVASAVGQGSTAISMVHEYLKSV
jgi:thioredoxin reductase (NADPH)